MSELLKAEGGNSTNYFFVIGIIIIISVLAISLSIEDAEALTGIKVIKGEITAAGDNSSLVGHALGKFKMKISDYYKIIILKIEMNEPPKEGHQYFVGFWESQAQQGGSLFGSEGTVITVEDLEIPYRSSTDLVVTERLKDSYPSYEVIGRASLSSLNLLLAEFPPKWKSVIEIQIRDKQAQTNALSVLVTERVVPLRPLDEFTYWQLVPRWNTENLTEDFFRVSDEEGNDVVDSSVVSGISRVLSHEIVPVICPPDDSLERAVFGRSSIVPLEEGNLTAFVKYTLPMLKTEDGKYRLKFWAFDDVDLQPPDNAKVISSNTIECSTAHRGFSMVTHYDITFVLE
jgi:hypothetical protein